MSDAGTTALLVLLGFAAVPLVGIAILHWFNGG